jgi:hypothetical protein
MSAMAALVDRTISPLLQTFEFERIRSVTCRKLRQPPQAHFDPSIAGKTYVKLNDDRSI